MDNISEKSVVLCRVVVQTNGSEFPGVVACWSFVLITLNGSAAREIFIETAVQQQQHRVRGTSGMGQTSTVVLRLES